MTIAEIVTKAKRQCLGCRREIPHKLIGGQLRHLHLGYPTESSTLFYCDAEELLVPLIQTTGKYQTPVWPDGFEEIFYST